MTLNLDNILPPDFADSARVWIYQSNRRFTETETAAIKQQVQAFAQSWLSHGAPVKGFGTVLYNQFIILLADETQTDVSGCSTDGSVRLIKSIEQQLGVDLFNRQQLAFVVNEEIVLIPLSHLNEALQAGTIHSETLYCNNTVLTKKEWQHQWLVPIRQSWLHNRVTSLAK